MAGSKALISLTFSSSDASERFWNIFLSPSSISPIIGDVGNFCELAEIKNTPAIAGVFLEDYARFFFGAAFFFAVFFFAFFFAAIVVIYY
jgi:hypothetical protein